MSGRNFVSVSYAAVLGFSGKNFEGFRENEVKDFRVLV
jgi:hypothetical protein